MIALGSAVLALGSLAQDTDVSFLESVVRVPRETRVALRDFDGDGDLDLLRADEEGVSVQRMDGGRFAEVDAVQLAWPDGRQAWDLADLDGDGACELVLVGESEVRAHRLLAEGFDAGRRVLEARSSLPAGLRRARFVRDVDGDGRADLVLPGPGAHAIHLARGEGWSAPIQVEYELQSSYAVGDPESLSSTFGQTLRVPWFELGDIDGDGDRDLVGRTTDRVAFHLAAPELSSQPTWVLDLEALRAELPRREGVNLDDLFANLENRVSWRIADLDGEGPRDLIVILGSKLRVYLGGAVEGPVADPQQVLKSSGTILWAFVRQVEGDALADLQLVRAERISIGRVVRSLILPSALDFDLFTYRNEGGAFSRRPTRTNRLTIEVPRLLSVMDDYEEMEDAFKEQWEIRARRLERAPGRPAAGDDVVDLRGEEIQLYVGCAPEPNVLEELVEGNFDPERVVEGYFLEDLDRRGDGAERRLDLGDLESFDFSPGALLRSACGDREPVARHALAFPAKVVSDLFATDLDGDGAADVLVVGRDKETKEWVIQALVRRDE